MKRTHIKPTELRYSSDVEKHHLPTTHWISAFCILISALTLPSFGQSIQFDASSPSTLTTNGNAITAWAAVKGGVTLMPIHGASNGWSTATLHSVSGRSTVSFTSQDGISVPSPLAFHGTETTQSVSAVFAIVRSQTPTPYMTLLDAPIDIRLESSMGYAFPFAGEGVPEGRGSGFSFQTEQLGNTATYAVNGKNTSIFLPSEGWQAVEVTFQTPVALDSLFVGGSVPSPTWNRGWDGEIAEIIFLPSDPTPEQRNALRHYARVKWRVAVDCDASHTSDAIVREIGVNPGNAFTTFLFVR